MGRVLRMRVAAVVVIVAGGLLVRGASLRIRSSFVEQGSGARADDLARGESRDGSRVEQQTPVAPKPTAPSTPESTKPAATVPATPKNALEKADVEAFFDGIVPLQ